jgi:catechol 2,3-dioxygenase-like lactoylglutathione lyase family enzyme
MSPSAIATIRQVDYTVIYVRDMAAMRQFYEHVMKFRLARQLSPGWIEYSIGATTLALAARNGRFDDRPPPAGALSVQLAFRVATSAIDTCAQELIAAGIEILSPPTDQPFGHRTLFFKDPDGNVLEIYAEL